MKKAVAKDRRLKFESIDERLGTKANHGGAQMSQKATSKTTELLGLVGAAFLIIWLGGCASSTHPNTYHSETPDRPVVDEKYRLTADREQLNEMRSAVPAEKKLENDEVAFSMALLADASKDPSRIREKFDSALSKKRELFSKDIQKERDTFGNTERKNREVFLKQLENDRREFLRSKHTKEERDDFFNRQEDQRKEYFESQRERRNDFESDVTERRKDFDDYARSKSTEFLQEYRAFQRRHDDYEKQKAAAEAAQKIKASAPPVTGTSVAPSSAAATAPAPDPEVKSFLQEYMDIPATPGTNLESGH